MSYFMFKDLTLIYLGGLITLLVIYQWWRDVSWEGSYQGLHTLIVEKGLRWGMVLFIISEIIFFMSFFWAFFHSRLSPNVELGGAWPPIGVIAFDPFSVPIINTIILLSSGVTVTWAHHLIMAGELSESLIALTITVVLGIYFTLIQLYEYIEAPFTIADSAFGSTFFIATGFHGVHVIVGTIFLFVGLVRIYNCSFSSNHHFGFEAAAWYWHFVDVVWLFLYVIVYWWGGK